MRDDSAAAFVEELQQRDPHLRRLARRARSAGLKSSLGISDIVQETVTRLTRYRHRCRSISEPAFRGLTRRITFRVVVDFVRQSRLGRFIVPGDVSLAGSMNTEGLVNSSTSISERAGRQELQQIALAMIHRLPEDYRTVVRLRYLEGEPFTDIAERMRRSVDSVQKLHVRAIEQLRRELEAIDGFKHI